MRASRFIPALAALIVISGSAAAQDTRQAVEQLEAGFQRLRFTPPTPHQVRLSNGVQVFLLEDHSLPQLQINIVGRHGVANLPDSLFPAGWQADVLMRTGGTTTLTSDSVDKLIDFYALQIGFSTGYETSTAFAGGLSRYSDQMIGLLFDMMRNPRDDTSRIHEMQSQVDESWRRRNDQPGSILARAWSQLMMGDHPLARSLVTPDEAAKFTPELIRSVQGRLYCPGRFVMGVTGDFVERDMVAKLERAFRGWAPCPAGNREMPPVHLADGPRIVVIDKDVTQSSIQMGHAGTIRVANTPEYFASQVADFLLGGGGGFNSRLLQRVRSDSGFAYSVFSDWGSHPKREGIFLAGAQTRANKTVASASLIRDVIASMASNPVTAADVKLAQDNEVNSYVFQFQQPSQIVAQQIQYVVDGLPPNWFDIYLQGIQNVTPDAVTDVVRRYVHPDHLVIVVVGKTSDFDGSLSRLGQVTNMTVDQIVR